MLYRSYVLNVNAKSKQKRLDGRVSNMLICFAVEKQMTRETTFICLLNVRLKPG